MDFRELFDEHLRRLQRQSVRLKSQINSAEENLRMLREQHQATMIAVQAMEALRERADADAAKDDKPAGAAGGAE